MTATKEEKIAIVQRGVDAYAVAEEALENAVNAFNALAGVYMDAADAGMVKAGKSHQIVNAHRRLAGGCAKIAEETYALHERGTKIAKDNDADVAVPTGYVVVMGGGDR